MQYLNKKKIKEFYHEQGKRISTEALDQLDSKIHRILLSSVELSKNFKTIKATEIVYAKG